MTLWTRDFLLNLKQFSLRKFVVPYVTYFVRLGTNLFAHIFCSIWNISCSWFHASDNKASFRTFEHSTWSKTLSRWLTKGPPVNQIETERKDFMLKYTIGQNRFSFLVSVNKLMLEIIKIANFANIKHERKKILLTFWSFVKIKSFSDNSFFFLMHSKKQTYFTE